MDVYMGSIGVQWSLAKVAVRIFDSLWAVFIYTGSHLNLKILAHGYKHYFHNV